MNNLRKLRKTAGLTMKELGKIVGMSESTISLYETGKHEPDIETMAKIADALHVSVDELIGRDEPEAKKVEPIISSSPQIVMMARAMEQMTPEQRDTMLNLGRAAFAQYFGINDENT